VWPFLEEGKMPETRQKKNGCLPQHLFEKYIEVYASKDMMSNFTRFIAFTYYLGAHVTGACLVIPYRGYTARRHKKDDADAYSTIGNLEWKPAKQTAIPGKSQPVYRLLFDDKDIPQPCYTTDEFFNYCQKMYKVQNKTYIITFCTN
jgi:hypothetical protein